MKIKSYYALLVLSIACLLAACKDQAGPGTSSGRKEFKFVCLQAFDDMEVNQVDHLSTQLKRVFKHVKVLPPIQLPQHAYYKPRQRYRADSLIRYLRGRSSKGEVIIGMTSKDISHTKGNIRDYGIMGLGYLPGSSCVISTFRLPADSLLPHTFKLAMHELGHTQGLPHCPKPACLMRDAKGKNHFNKQTGFCKSCKTFLLSKGWQLK